MVEAGGAAILLILQAFGSSEQFWDRLSSLDCAADLAHGFADCVEEGPTGILHQVPAICDLHRVRQCLRCGFPIPSATITGDDRDRGTRGQPGLRGRGFTIRQHCDIRRLSRLQMMLAYR